MLSYTTTAGCPGRQFLPVRVAARVKTIFDGGAVAPHYFRLQTHLQFR